MSADKVLVFILIISTLMGIYVKWKQFKDDQRRIVQELLRLYVAFDIIELNEAEFDAFITFLNIDEQFIKTATEMELILFIKDKYEHYKQLNR